MTLNRRHNLCTPFEQQQQHRKPKNTPSEKKKENNLIFLAEGPTVLVAVSYDAYGDALYIVYSTVDFHLLVPFRLCLVTKWEG